MAKDKEKHQKYYSADVDKMKKKLDEIGSGTYFKPKEGKNNIRILPPWSKKGLWYKEATLHYGLADESGKERGFPCLKQFGEECPICAKKEELLEGSAEDKKLADRIRPRTKFYANILDRNTGKVMIWGFSQKTLGILLSYEQDPDYGESVEGGITNPDEGFDVIVERTGTTRNDTRYQIRCRPKPSEVDMDSLELHNLDEVVVSKMTEEELEEVLESNFGSGPSKKSKKHKEDDEEEEEEEEESEEEEPKKKKKKHSEDEEDEDSDDEDDEEEEEEKPRKKKKKHHREEDEDDEDEDEDDE